MGFTLLEILVVMMIIGLLASVAVLSVGNRESATAQEARRLAELLRLSAEEAVLQGREWGLHLTGDGYEFMVLDAALWRVAIDEILRPRRFPPDVTSRLTLEGEELQVDPPPDDAPLRHNASRTDKENAEARITPQVLLLSSGEVSLFQIAVQGRGQPTWYVRSSIDGNFSVIPATP